MVFSSITFLFFFLPICLLIYFLLDNKFKNNFLLLASLFFYFWGEPKFIFIMICSITINYLGGLIIFRARNKDIKKGLQKLVLAIFVAMNLALLFTFKYLDFAITSLNQIAGTNLSLMHIALPIGISFFTFHGLSYIIDLYWGNVNVQRNPLKMALYISLFPQLVAGPIVRYKDVHKQIDNRSVTIADFSYGINRFIIGLGKKIIIANSLALAADNIFNTPYYEHTMATAWVGIICYTLQIYFDFSGYSDMAIGLARMFGFRFLENFNYPYISKSITEFWRRWHISLSSWFRDYVYIPLGGNRKGNQYVNLLIVFVLTGLWHGAAWNFLIWGLWHGTFIITEKLLKKSPLGKVKLPKLLSLLYTLFVVVIGWVFFRADNLSYAIGYLQIMFGIASPHYVGFSTMYYLDNYTIFMLALGVIGSTNFVEYLKKTKIQNEMVDKCISAGNLLYLAVVLLVSIVMVMSSTYNPFIYFRF